MLFTTPMQYLILAALLGIGWLFGYASNAGGAKWRKRYRKIVDDSNAYRADIDTRLRDARNRAATHEREGTALRQRIAELEGKKDKKDKKGKDSGDTNHNDLARIRGIDPELQAKLEALGVRRYDDIVGLSGEDEIALEQRLGIPAGYITREQWREQAELLEAGKPTEHERRFGPE